MRNNWGQQDLLVNLCKISLRRSLLIVTMMVLGNLCVSFNNI